MDEEGSMGTIPKAKIYQLVSRANIAKLKKVKGRNKVAYKKHPSSLFQWKHTIKREGERLKMVISKRKALYGLVQTIDIYWSNNLKVSRHLRALNIVFFPFSYQIQILVLILKQIRKWWLK